MSPENQCLEDDSCPIEIVPFKKGHVCFRGCNHPEAGMKFDPFVFQKGLLR